MRRSMMVLLACVVALAAGTAFAQVPPAQTGQPRDRAVTQKTGSGVIKGRVVAADSGAAVRRARVALDTGNPLDTRSTTADMDGRYEFTDLAAGTYRVSAQKGMFVPFEHGQGRPNQRGKAIELTDGQVAEKIDIALPRGGVIGGVLLDDAGEPAAGVRITAMRQQFREGKRIFTNTGRAVETNDLGQFRIYGLPAGSYFVAAMPLTSNPLMPILTTSSGAATYYPGTLSEAEAQRVAVRPGQERTLPDFTLVPGRLVKISGTATNATGGPVQVVMLMKASDAAGGGTTMPSMNTAMVRPDGTFRLNNIAPGEYMLMATAVNIGSGEQEITTMPLTVAGEDITDLAITTTKGFVATGQILFDQGTPPPGVSPSAVMLVAGPASSTAITGGLGRATVREDWTFEAKGLAGARRFQIGQGLPAGWVIQSVFHKGDDVTDKPLEVREDIDGVIITLTNRPGKIAGTVTDSAGKAVTDCTVLVFPDETALGPPHSTRFVRALRPGEEGKFKSETLPASTYLVVAVDALEPGEEYDPELLEQLRPLATRTIVGWGETREVPLKLSKFERR